MQKVYKKVERLNGRFVVSLECNGQMVAVAGDNVLSMAERGAEQKFRERMGNLHNHQLTWN